MGFKREEIRDWSELSLKKLNDNIRYLWMKAFGEVDFGDLTTSTQNTINGKLGLIENNWTRINCTNGALTSKTVTLPVEFKGKQFQVIPNIKALYPTPYNSSSNLISFRCFADTYDIENGTFSISASVTYQNVSFSTLDVDVSYIAIA